MFDVGYGSTPVSIMPLQIRFMHNYVLNGLRLRSHLERGPAEFVELKIWASSASSLGFGRALCDSHTQVVCLAYIFRTEVSRSPSELWRTPAGRRPNGLPICRISGWPRAVNAISSAGHLWAPAECMLHGKVRARWRHSAGPALLGASCQRVATSLEKLAAL